jgi:hypothetical protein
VGLVGYNFGARPRTYLPTYLANLLLRTQTTYSEYLPTYLIFRYLIKLTMKNLRPAAETYLPTYLPARRYALCNSTRVVQLRMNPGLRAPATTLRSSRGTGETCI